MPAWQTEIPRLAARTPLLLCIADFTWAPCQVYTVSIKKCFNPKLKVLQDALILRYHSLASDDLTFLCCFA